MISLEDMFGGACLSPGGLEQLVAQAKLFRDLLLFEELQKGFL